MLNRVFIGTGILAILGLVFFLGSLTLSTVFAQSPQSALPTLTSNQATSTGSSGINESDNESHDGQSEATDLQPTGTAKITTDQAKAAALTQFPGANIIKVELEDANGALVYGVTLDYTGKTYDLEVDANSGKIIKTDTNQAENQNETENVQS